MEKTIRSLYEFDNEIKSALHFLKQHNYLFASLSCEKFMKQITKVKTNIKQYVFRASFYQKEHICLILNIIINDLKSICNCIEKYYKTQIILFNDVNECILNVYSVQICLIPLH